MSRKETIEYVSPMQQALLNAALKRAEKTGWTGTARRVGRVADRVKLKQMPAVNTKLSYRTAQKLLAAGDIE